MNETRFTQQNWLEGETAPAGLGPVEAILGIVPATVEAEGGRDRHDARLGRKKADTRRRQIANIDAGKPERIINGRIVKETKFTLSREIRTPLPSKRGVPTEVIRPHNAEALVREHHITVARGIIDAALRQDILFLSSEVDAILKETREADNTVPD